MSFLEYSFVMTFFFMLLGPVKVIRWPIWEHRRTAVRFRLVVRKIDNSVEWTEHSTNGFF